MNSRSSHTLPNTRWLDELARLMDAKFRIPGTRFRFGLDPILGLLPGLGDAASFAVSGGLLLAMIRYGASRKVIILMLLNVLLDTTLGSIPIIGNIFDFFYKANIRNLSLLKAHYEEGKYQGSGNGILFLVAAILIGFLILMLWGTWELAEWIYEALTT
jgi:hypothetical protein